MSTAIDRLRRLVVRSYYSERIRHSDTFLDEINDITGESMDVAELFHENTKFNTPQDINVRGSFAQFESPDLLFAQAKSSPDYPGHKKIDLPEPELPNGCSLAEVLDNRRSQRNFNPETIPKSTVASLLGYSCGVSTSGKVHIGELDMSIQASYRTYPSGGALYPIEIYPILLRCEDLPTGITYYTARTHSLRILQEKEQNFISKVGEYLAGDNIEIEDSALIIVMSAAFPRIKAKYGPRGYRYALQESGHIAQNIQLVAEALGLVSVPTGGLYDYQINELLQIDGVNEAAIYGVVVGAQEGK